MKHGLKGLGVRSHTHGHCSLIDLLAENKEKAVTGHGLTALECHMTGRALVYMLLSLVSEGEEGGGCTAMKLDSATGTDGLTMHMR